MLSTPPKQFEQNEIDEYEMFGLPPADFDPSDPNRIRIFADRLKASRTDLTYRLRDVASELGLSIMCISKYEKAKMAKIPMDHLRRLSVFLGVSPHFLLGYVDDPSTFLRLDAKRNIICDNEGNPKLLHQGAQFAPASFQFAIKRYQELYSTDVELFYLLDKLIASSTAKRAACKQVLDAILSLF